ncbi:AMP-binding enzyme family protein (macronuclear) [Tetrahymena thermophila SB210]|uniref:AMP-binding enzyme family protein n=1 Tax=Tetrahymena thermophila (strain SB210) TaxID=312017 RepID=Q233T0_TETTS|nr:AMP-binding enzyme family protein [Tetrahymena thermophila SB210]EAR91749.2 AMP-binding enzyme family protein [Tetrahymena thermophila SB210]|eukprot:XP_001011994.2 AMP-binding enzyme family protein [Tetrahymena thermophila SB210]
MVFENLDFLSSPFQFNIGNQQQRKRTKIGGLLSTAIFLATVAYFIYNLILYFSNSIDPKFIAQSFVTNNEISVDLHNDLVGFRFEHKVNQGIDVLEKEQNKTYLVYLPFFEYIGNTSVNLIQLNITDCTNPQLQGFKCLDFTQLQNYTLTLNSLSNILSRIDILLYRCQDTDSAKTTIPDNCASPEEIDQVINNLSGNFHLKLFTSQFNTSSQMVQTNFRKININTYSGQFIYSKLKTQQQKTKIQQGSLIQQESTFTSPLNYELVTQVFDYQTFKNMTDSANILQASIQMDEIVTYFQIQFHTFPEILAVCNSTLALLMLIGVVAKYFAQKLIKEDFFLLYLQNFHQGTYENILKINKLLCKDQDSGKDSPTCNQIQTKGKELEEVDIEEIPEQQQQMQETDNAQSILVPCFQSTFIDNFQSATKSTKLRNDLNSFYDATKEVHWQGTEQLKIKKSYSNKTQRTSLVQKGNLCKKQDQNSQITNLSNLKDDSPNLSLPFAKINQQKKNNSLTYQNQKQINSSPLSIKKEQSTYDFVLKNSIAEQQTIKYNSFFNKHLLTKIQKIIFGFKIWKYQNHLQSIGLNVQEKRQIEEQVNQSVDILQLYQDIIFLKKAIMILFTSDQLATLKITGFSPNCSSSKNSTLSFNFTKGNINGLNYLESQYFMQKSKEQELNQINKFIIRCQDKSSMSEIDQRIYSSLNLV